MKLITKALEKKLPKLYAQDGKGEEAIVYVHFFTTWNYWEWFITEYNPETGEAFGLVKGDETEYGYISIKELEGYTHRNGMKIERDKYFTPKTLSEVKSIYNL